MSAELTFRGSPLGPGGGINRYKVYASVPNASNRSRRGSNPVRVGATVTGSGTGWIKAKAVKIVRGKGGTVRVDVKR